MLSDTSDVYKTVRNGREAGATIAEIVQENFDDQGFKTTLVLNPLHKFPPGVLDLIFQHMTGSEIITQSEVSTDFYNFIAGSKACMGKINLKLDSRLKVFTNEDKELLIGSGRNYENLKVATFKRFLQPAKDILSTPDRCWSNVSITGVDFETVNDALEFLFTFQSTVEQLHMERVYILKDDPNSHVDLQFPKLKILEMKCCQALLYPMAFDVCTNLIHFTIKSGSQISSAALNGIRKILVSNEKLKVLRVQYSVVNLIFSEDISSKVHFKLTEFHADDLYREPGQQAIKENLNRFLIKQSATLEEVSIDEWMDAKLMKTILTMPLIKAVTLNGFDHLVPPLECEDFETHNKSIVNLNFKLFVNDFLYKILPALPNLKSLVVKNLDQRTMDILPNACSDLDTLSASIFYFQTVSDKKFFKKLQKFTCVKGGYKRFDPEDSLISL